MTRLWKPPPRKESNSLPCQKINVREASLSLLTRMAWRIAVLSTLNHTVPWLSRRLLSTSKRHITGVSSTLVPTTMYLLRVNHLVYTMIHHSVTRVRMLELKALGKCHHPTTPVAVSRLPQLVVRHVMCTHSLINNERKLNPW